MKYLPPNTILTQEKAREIRAKSQAGMNMGQLAKAYGVAHTTIRRILRNQSWREE